MTVIILKYKIMKTKVFFFVALFLLTSSIATYSETATGSNPSQKGSINVFASPDLYNLTMQWAEEYKTLHPDITINVTKSTDNNMPGLLNAESGIGFMTHESLASASLQSIWNMVVGRDVIVPVMNAKNPFINEINRKGITQQNFSRLFTGKGNQTWGNLFENGQNVPVHCYLVNNPSVKSGLADFLNNKQFATDCIEFASAAELFAAIQKDPTGLGFCRLTDLADINNQGLANNIQLVPIDKNGNGKIDFMENIYENQETFARGVWIGKYPKALSGNIYSIAAAKPTNEDEIAFLRWVLSDGQQYLSNNGYSDLVSNERQTQSDKLNDTVIFASSPNNNNNAMVRLVLLVVFAFAFLGLMANFIVRRNHHKKVSSAKIPVNSPTVFEENSVIAPKGLFFDKTHTWAFMEKDGSVKIGVDDFLQHITGPVTSVGMKPAGVKIKKGEQLLTIIQKGKHLTIYSPVSGTISSFNQTLLTNSALLNAAPYTEGWVYVIEPTNWLRETQFLLMSEKYMSWIKGEFSRVKDFIATAVKSGTPEFAFVTLQDGGTLKDSILEDLGPEVWEDFQTKFIDCTK